MTTGDIFWVNLANQANRAQSGRRPCIVLQDQSAGRNSPMVLVVPLTTSSSATRFGSTVSIVPSRLNGLPIVSLALIFQLRAADRQEVDSRIGQLESDDLTAVFAELDRLTGR